MLQLKKEQLIVFDGDSLTNRRSAGRPDTWPFLRLMNWDKPWPDMVAEMLFCWRPELKLSFFNAGSGGSTCRGLAERFETNVLARKPGWYIASLAGNDVRVGIPLEEFRETMTTCAKRLIDECGTEVLFFGLSDAPADYPKLDTLDARRKFFDILSDIAAKTDGVHYADLGPRFAAKAAALKEQADCHTVYGDVGHFNAVGNLLVAGEILRVFGVVCED
jgi:GDSL-like Lipase/Acylhydrolase family